MQNRLPEIIEPLNLADKRGELHGQLPLNSLIRLNEKLVNNEGVVDVNLYFGREGRTPYIEGNLETTLFLVCQKCLQGVEFKVNNAVKLGIATKFEYVERLPSEYEPLLVEEETFLLSKLVEDELLLSLPDYPKHEYDCMVEGVSKEVVSAFDEIAPEKPNPFSVLAHLKKSTGES
jgi:uncharacterized protein